MTELYKSVSDEQAQSGLDLKARVYLDQVALFLAHSRTSLIAIAIFTVAVTLAWQDYVPLSIGVPWCTAACSNYLAQGLMCWRMLHAPSLAFALPRWMPWLYASVIFSSIIWGMVPWFFLSASTQTLVFAALFNAMLLFCVLNAPNTLSMTLCATLPLSILTIAALATRQGMLLAAAGLALIIGVVFFYALRVHTAIHAFMRERHTAKDLTDKLRLQQQRVIEYEKERSVLLERQRLMRDMHDGMGSTLLASLAAVEQGGVDTKGVAAILRECMDDLRMVIDSLEPMDYDLTTLLGTLRYRLDTTLQAHDIALDWRMQDLPPLQWMGPSEALQLMRIVQEVLSNIIKHAQAKHVVIEATCVEEDIQVCIKDDGVGFDAMQRSAGRGLRFLCQRAKLLGAELQLVSTLGSGTTVRLMLPMHRQVD